jgi:hypothetical protein
VHVARVEKPERKRTVSRLRVGVDENISEEMLTEDVRWTDLPHD